MLPSAARPVQGSLRTRYGDPLFGDMLKCSDLCRLKKVALRLKKVAFQIQCGCVLSDLIDLRSVRFISFSLLVGPGLVAVLPEIQHGLDKPAGGKKEKREKNKRVKRLEGKK